MAELAGQPAFLRAPASLVSVIILLFKVLIQYATTYEESTFSSLSLLMPKGCSTHPPSEHLLCCLRVTKIFLTLVRHVLSGIFRASGGAD